MFAPLLSLKVWASFLWWVSRYTFDNFIIIVYGWMNGHNIILGFGFWKLLTGPCWPSWPIGGVINPVLSLYHTPLMESETHVWCRRRCWLYCLHIVCFCWCTPFIVWWLFSWQMSNTNRKSKLGPKSSRSMFTSLHQSGYLIFCWPCPSLWSSLLALSNIVWKT